MRVFVFAIAALSLLGPLQAADLGVIFGLNTQKRDCHKHLLIDEASAVWEQSPRTLRRIAAKLELVRTESYTKFFFELTEETDHIFKALFNLVFSKANEAAELQHEDSTLTASGAPDKRIVVPETYIFHKSGSNVFVEIDFALDPESFVKHPLASKQLRAVALKQGIPVEDLQARIIARLREMPPRPRVALEAEFDEGSWEDFAAGRDVKFHTTPDGSAAYANAEMAQLKAMMDPLMEAILSKIKMPQTLNTVAMVTPTEPRITLHGQMDFAGNIKDGIKITLPRQDARLATKLLIQDQSSAPDSRPQ
jgi:hypothetical protein